MPSRREQILDAAITLLGEQGMRALTHRAVDATAGLPTGSTSNYFRTSDALLTGVVERFAERERANWDNLAATMAPTNRAELIETMAGYVHDGVTRNRTLTLSRYAILIEASHRPALRDQLTASGSRVNQWFLTWFRIAGTADPERDAPLLMNMTVGLVLHELANPSPHFDPTGPITAMIDALSNKEALARRGP